MNMVISDLSGCVGLYHDTKLCRDFLSPDFYINFHIAFVRMVASSTADAACRKHWKYHHPALSVEYSELGRIMRIAGYHKQHYLVSEISQEC